MAESPIKVRARRLRLLLLMSNACSCRSGALTTIWQQIGSKSQKARFGSAARPGGCP
jgi:hypothetical protein